MKVNRRETTLTTRLFRVEHQWYSAPDGSTFERDVVIHPGAVVILPVLDDGRIVLIRNYRTSVGKELIELPAGTREPDEQPIETARRELAEETGYQAQRMEPLMTFFASPGVLNERMHAFVATALSPAAGAAPEAHEYITPMAESLDAIKSMMVTGAIEDAKTLAVLGVYLLGCGL